jgi:dipeptidyl aminopeptidase/acylaminoacyl peptidase
MKGIDSRRMARLDFHRYAARDGRQIPLWITEPRRAEGSAPPPAVVLVHGGPWLRGGSWHWHALPQFLASRGYVVIEPEFRGSTGYGSEHFRAGWKQWGQAMQDDVTDAVRWAVAGKRIDGKRVCIAGGSYGGYATLMGLVRDPDLYRCGAAWAAVSEPMRMLEGSWWWADDTSDEARRYSLPVLLGDPKTDAEMLKAISPLQQAARIKAPLLLVHGEADRRVPFVHAKEMREALRRNGQEPEWLTFPEEAHGWRKLENQRAFARRLESFLAQHLK